MSRFIIKVAIGLTCLLICGVLYAPKIKEIRKLMVEIDQVEAKQAEFYHLQVEFESLSEEDKEKWKKVEEKLSFAIFPERDALRFIEELAKVAKECYISDISFNTDYTIAENMQKASASNSEDISIGIDYFAVKFLLQCQYRELVCFLDGIENLAYFVEIESLEIRRGIPLISTDLVVKAYYLKEESHAQK